jgi:hypothetical protein
LHGEWNSDASSEESGCVDVDIGTHTTTSTHSESSRIPRINQSKSNADECISAWMPPSSHSDLSRSNISAFVNAENPTMEQLKSQFSNLSSAFLNDILTDLMMNGEIYMDDKKRYIAL